MVSFEESVERGIEGGVWMLELGSCNTVAKGVPADVGGSVLAIMMD